MKKIIPILLILIPFWSPSQLMYPGDANNDGIANHIDLLIIGVAWDEFGNERVDPSLGWYAHAFFPWTYQTPETGTNGGYIDADGNSLIDTLDIDAIALNYEMEQDSAGPIPWEPPFNCLECPEPVLRIDFEEDILVAPDTAWADIILDYGGIPVPPELGSMALAFGIEYEVDTLAIDDAQTIIEPTDTPERMYIVATNQGATAFRTVQPFRAQIAVSHFKENGFLTTHQLARVGIIIEDIQRNSDTLNAEFAIRFEGPIYLINNLEQRIGVITETEVLKVVDYNVRATEVQELPELKLFPNPAKQQIRLEVMDAFLQHVRVLDVQGRSILERTLEVRASSYVLDVGRLASGVYWVEVWTDVGRSVQKLIVL